MEIVNFNSYDGTSLTGIFSGPKKATQGLLMMHGLPSDKDESGFYSDMANYLNDNGIATFRFDFRYNGESQAGNLSELTLSEMLLDIESAYWILVDRLGQNAQISAVGTSCGGGITIRWRNVFNRKLRRIFLMAPVLDYEFEVTGKRKQRINENYQILDDSELAILEKTGKLNEEIGYGYQMINEAHLFDIKEEFSKCVAPITVYQGDSDSIVPIVVTREEIMNFSEIEMVEIPDADHGFAVLDDDDLTDPETKANHYKVYKSIFDKLS